MPTLRAGWQLYTSRTLKRGVEAVWRRVHGMGFSTSSSAPMGMTSEPPITFLPGFWGRAEVRFLCGIKAGGRFAPSRQETPPRNAGRGFGVGGRFSAFWLWRVVEII